jgi:6-phosphofructokinase 1
MNSAIRTVAVVGIGHGHQVIGIRGGYKGLMEGDAAPLTLADVHGISRFGGTVLASTRYDLFATKEGQEKAKSSIARLSLDALIVIGGNGSLAGAARLGEDRPCTIVGIPASIDNDIGHTGLSIGVDTAVNTIVEACDRLSDTARACKRAFLVEVMGRQCGFLAMRAGLAAEADAILYGEGRLSEQEVVEKLRKVMRRCFAPDSSKQRALIVIAEGVGISTERLKNLLTEHLPEDAPDVVIRTTVLGHVVRGGSPSALDRVIAQRLGYAAVLCAEAGHHNMMVGWDVPGNFGAETNDPHVRVIPLAEVLEETRKLVEGTSEVVQQRVKLLNEVENLLSL